MKALLLLPLVTVMASVYPPSRAVHFRLSRSEGNGLLPGGFGGAGFAK